MRVKTLRDDQSKVVVADEARLSLALACNQSLFRLFPHFHLKDDPLVKHKSDIWTQVAMFTNSHALIVDIVFDPLSRSVRESV